MSSAMIEALRNSFFGPPGGAPSEEGPRRGTLAHASAAARTWLEEHNSPEAVLESLSMLGTAVDEAIAARQSDLAGAGQMDPSLKALAYACVDAMNGLSRAVQDLKNAVSGQDRDRTSRLLETLGERARILEERQVAVEEWMARAVPTCPGCGCRETTRDGRCRSCGLLALVPDPSQDDDDAELVTLSPAFVRVYQVCHAVAAGAGSLEDLEDALARLGQEITAAWLQVDSFLQSGARGMPPVVNDLLESLRARLSEILEGVFAMQEFAASRSVQHLNEGWRRVAEGAMALQQTLGALAGETDDDEARGIMLGVNGVLFTA